MGRLVGDLILLAKSRRPDFVALGAVDLADLTETVLAKARALGDRELGARRGPARGTVSLDEQRITQAMLQLADNAVKHTDVGDTVADRRRRSTPTSCACGCATAGPGVPPADRERGLRAIRPQPRPVRRRGLRPGPLHRGAIAERARRWCTRRGAARPAPGARVEIRVPRRGGERTWPRS